MRSGWGPGVGVGGATSQLPEEAGVPREWGRGAGVGVQGQSGPAGWGSSGEWRIGGWGAGGHGAEVGESHVIRR